MWVHSERVGLAGGTIPGGVVPISTTNLGHLARWMDRNAVQRGMGRSRFAVMRNRLIVCLVVVLALLGAGCSASSQPALKSGPKDKVACTQLFSMVRAGLSGSRGTKTGNATFFSDMAAAEYPALRTQAAALAGAGTDKTVAANALSKIIHICDEMGFGTGG